MELVPDNQLCEVFGLSQLSHCLGDKRERVLVFCHDLIELPVVNTEPEFAIELLDKQHRRGPWRAAGLDEVSFEVLLQVLSDRLELFRRYIVQRRIADFCP